ncbi:peptide deformylase [Novipirellula artificiosorum]|uniref:Peptide deformylase n=1 Tax=Novipirellula artificiosorum TaxID=2528016 RepID=A0A5C6DA41_9BACT|nr:peptide deformylase [Novipirellula artificiosorum]TWU32577.1 Peptide deformylase [Novipirellula artificiosorum]
MPLSIVHYPHPTLRYRSKPIRRVDQALRGIADEMLDLMYQFNGVGLAANQVDLPLRLFVANPAGKRDEGEELILVNPELQMPRGNESDQEGCLSLPGLYGQVKRPKAIRVSAYDLKGNSIERSVDGFLARVLMHENDHLDGVLFFDRMTDEARRELIDPLAEFETDFRSRQSTGEIPTDEDLIGRLDEWTERYA